MSFSTIGMKKNVWIIVILIIIALGIWYVKKVKTTPADTSMTTYKNSETGLSFNYPKILTLGSNGNTVTLHHEVPFAHHDFCDFKGERMTTIPNLTDFNVKFHIVGKSLIDTMKTESPYIPQENFVNGKVVESPGFIDRFAVGNLKGWRIFEGAEGCGQTIYYFPISGTTTLVVQSELITLFSGAIDERVENQAMDVPGVINKEKNQEIFRSVLKTLQIQ